MRNPNIRLIRVIVIGGISNKEMDTAPEVEAYRRKRQRFFGKSLSGPRGPIGNPVWETDYGVGQNDGCRYGRNYNSDDFLGECDVSNAPSKSNRGIAFTAKIDTTTRGDTRRMKM